MYYCYPSEKQNLIRLMDQFVRLIGKNERNFKLHERYILSVSHCKHRNIVDVLLDAGIEVTISFIWSSRNS